ncbi:hypothetical protein LTR62_006107 [Meristemomyces frigidus]|uniref:Uncharacterized protein n=1 Tax=Meristemomyces frigidus TaxID=1508187 RepID=A0AAN7TC40_9PEZI|nr:hypothetical protein LTR62_006107 [Meristemomyces frigidus]
MASQERARGKADHSIEAEEPGTSPFPLTAVYDPNLDSHSEAYSDGQPTEWGFARASQMARLGDHSHEDSVAPTLFYHTQNKSLTMSDESRNVPPSMSMESQVDASWWHDIQPVEERQGESGPSAGYLNYALVLEEEARILRHMALQQQETGMTRMRDEQRPMLAERHISQSQPIQQEHVPQGMIYPYFNDDGTIHESLSLGVDRTANWWEVGRPPPPRQPVHEIIPPNTTDHTLHWWEVTRPPPPSRPPPVPMLAYAGSGETTSSAQPEAHDSAMSITTKNNSDKRSSPACNERAFAMSPSSATGEGNGKGAGRLQQALRTQLELEMESAERMTEEAPVPSAERKRSL